MSVNRNARVRELLTEHRRLCDELTALGVHTYHPPPPAPKWVREILADAQLKLSQLLAAQ